MTSAKLTPAAPTSISTWPGPGYGSGRSCTWRTDGSPCWVRTTARMRRTLSERYVRDVTNGAGAVWDGRSMLAYTLAGGAWVFLGVVLAFFLAIIYGLYSGAGSAINQHPYGNEYGDATGARLPSSYGNDRLAAAGLVRRPKRR